MGRVEETGGEISIKAMQIYIISKAPRQPRHDDGRSTGQLNVSQDRIEKECSRKGSK